jgi:hypothetical protein
VLDGIVLTIIVQKYANNEIRFGVQSLKNGGRGKGDTASVSRASRYAEAIQEVETASCKLRIGNTYERDRAGRHRVNSYDSSNFLSDVRSPLDIIGEFQRASCGSSKKGGWGYPAKLTTFGKKARHALLQAGAVVDKECDKNIYEVTCTIPGSTPEAFEAVANWSGWIMNRLLQPIRRHDKNACWFYVWELQKRGALHLHFAIAASTLAEAKLLAEGLEYQWWELLLELSEKAKVDVFRRSEQKSWRDKPAIWQSHVAQVKKSVAAYFSKYLGKAVSRSQTQKERGGKVYCPARWWGCSSKVKELIAQSTMKYQILVTTLQSETFMREFNKFLANPGKVSEYSYDFDLGLSNSGYPIGHGCRTIHYYEPRTFDNMCSWLDVMVEGCADIAGIESSCILRSQTDVCNEFDLIRQFQARRANPSPSPSKKRSSYQPDSLLSRGTQAKPALDRKVVDIQSLHKGMGKDALARMSEQRGLSIKPLHTSVVWGCMQLTLFDLYKYM